MSEVETRVHHTSDGLLVERWQDCEPIIERNKRLQNMPQKSDWGRHVASIPCVILEKWLNEEALRGNHAVRLFSEEFNQIVAKKLKDPDWRWLRTDK